MPGKNLSLKNGYLPSTTLAIHSDTGLIFSPVDSKHPLLTTRKHCRRFTDNGVLGKAALCSPHQFNVCASKCLPVKSDQIQLKILGNFTGPFLHRSQTVAILPYERSSPPTPSPITIIFLFTEADKSLTFVCFQKQMCLGSGIHGGHSWPGKARGKCAGSLSRDVPVPSPNVNSL